MPFINTNDIETHKRLKIRVTEIDSTIGKLVDHYIKVGLELQLESLDEEEIKKLKRLVVDGKVKQI